MPQPAISLFGFLDQQSALTYLTRACVPTNPAQSALLAEWRTAQAQLGDPFPNSGKPTIEDIPHVHVNHVQSLLSATWLSPTFAEGWQLRVVEIEPLLAFQFHIDLDRSKSLCAGLPDPPTLADVMELCLPVNQPTEQVRVTGQPQSLIITSPNLNLRTVNRGMLGNPPSIAGIEFAIALPLIQVVSCNDRCYLRNGFHRAFGIQKRGLGEIPCLYREVKNLNEVGAEGKGGTFEQTLLESKNPPTLAHFTQDRAYPVMLRRFSRVIHASWADYLVPEE